jgi:uncharacterized membrane protein SpoIIM required for sporulation
MEDFVLKSSEFRREREESWMELEALLDRIERSGFRSLSGDDLNRLPTLYRGVVSSLSVARAISLDKNVLDYLTNLASRAYVAVYSSKKRPIDAVVSFLTVRLPRSVRRYAGFLAAAVLCLVAGTLCGYLLTLGDVERFYSFVPEEMAGGRTPASSTEELRKVLYAGDEDDKDKLQLFATFLFTHNAKIGILCFALGFAAGAPVVFLLFYNGLVLGAMAALYDTRGLQAEFWAWVLPHGVTELLAVCLCGAAGLVFGLALVFPGEHSRLENLARRGRQAALVVIGAVILFFMAALIEGFFRQGVQSVAARWTVAGVSLSLWIAYFGWVGRGNRDED